MYEALRDGFLADLYCLDEENLSEAAVMKLYAQYKDE